MPVRIPWNTRRADVVKSHFNTDRKKWEVSMSYKVYASWYLSNSYMPEQSLNFLILLTSDLLILKKSYKKVLRHV